MKKHSRFFPEHYAASAYDVPYETLYNEGYRGIIYDIDNTLVAHGAPADERAENLMRRLRGLGFQICLLSNNSSARVALFNKNIGLLTVCRANKPSAKGYEKAMRLMGTDRSNTVMIGDQIFTDICGANRAGVHNILVHPLYRREIAMVRIKRLPEKVILHSYRRHYPQEFRKGEGD